MKKFMVVFRIDGEQGTNFFDDWNSAEAFRMDVECGVGGYVETYQRKHDANGIEVYEMLY